uniref:Uncharacterized protein n=1 Tax=Anopheles stephensi TaxID=30069 RepID=A0A182Y8S7_ANOST
MQYGIPRSTLRNKVYKLAIGSKRNIASLLEDDDDKDSLDDDTKDGELLDKHVLAEMLMKMYGGTGGTPRPQETSLTRTPPATATPPAHRATPEPASLDIAGMSLKPIALSSTPRQSVATTATPPATTQPPQSSPLVAAAASTLLNPNLVMQVERILQVTATSQASGETQQALAELPELLRKIIDQQQLLADQIKKASGSSGVPPAAGCIQPSVSGSAGSSPTIAGLSGATGVSSLVNSSALDAALARSPSLSAALNANGTGGQGASIDPCYIPFFQQLQQQQQQHGKLRTMSAGTPDAPTSISSIELNDASSDDPHVILKIPSYGRAPGASPGVGVPASSKNGDLERHLQHHNMTTPSPPTAAAAAVLSSLVAAPVRAPHASASPQTNLLNSVGNGGTGIGGVASAPASSQVSLASSLSSSSPLSSLSVASSIAQQDRGNAQSNHLSVISPPLMNLPGVVKAESAISPPVSGHHGSAATGLSAAGGKSMLSVHEVIARSISKNFQQQQSDMMHKQQMDQMKRPSISVIKTLGDISHFGNGNAAVAAAAAAAGLGSVGNAAQLAAAAAAAAANNTGTGGKGTRPKRGKYRNYDRDSLVEAVKAVQRGEMSVHRAGSYYGVPHSTLEYKVKERHLMRPRKREPKPQPGLDDHRLGGSSSGKGSADGSSSLRGLDKGKGGMGGLGAGSKGAAGMGGHSGKNHHHLQQQTQQSQFSTSSPNGALGAKMPMFDASSIGYGSPFFWPHHASGFGGMPGVDFARGQPGPDGVFNSPTLMQRFQQEATASPLSPADTRHYTGGKSVPAGVSAAAAASLAALPKGSSVREMAEQLYDGSGANGGSFLDDIIRQSLDKKSGELTGSHNALFDHLLKGKLRSSAAAAGSVGTAEDANTAALLAKAATKRAATSPPLAFHPESVKRERASPGASSTSSTGSSNNNRLGVSLGSDQQHHGLGLQHQQQQQQNPSQSAACVSTPELLLAKNVESLMKLQENLSSMSAAHLQRTAMEELNGMQGSTGISASRASLLGHQSDSADQHGSDGETDTDSLRSNSNHHGHSLRHSLLQQHHHHHHQRGLTDDSS